MMMWFLFLLYIARTELVISQGSPGGGNRLVLKGERPCQGHIEVYHEGEWGYVGHTYWDDSIENVVCKSAHCGERKPSRRIFRPDDKRVWLDDIKCKGTEDHLWDCDYPRWGELHDFKKEVKYITCSDEITISLEGQSCAGAVTYSINGKKKGYFCEKKWSKATADVVCKSVGCGSAEDGSYDKWTTWPENSEKTMIDCSGIKDLKNLWQCVTDVSSSQCTVPVAVKCAGHKRLQLKKDANSLNACSGLLQKEVNGNWINVNNEFKDAADAADACSQMHCGGSLNYSRYHGNQLLTCTDNVSVVLMDDNKPSRCYGQVHVEVNNNRHPVCASTWEETEAQVVCRELNCGGVVSQSSPQSRSGGGIMDNVNCLGKESSLWHCGAKHGKKPNFQCSKIARVTCSESVNVRLVDGPGKCAGRVEIHYMDKWWPVKEKEWITANSETVCKQLNCGTVGLSGERFCHGSGEFLPMTVKCKADTKNISECTMTPVDRGQRDSRDDKAVSLTCQEHKVVFLEGTCSGKVGIAHGDKTYWLSGNNDTWNSETANTVCKQMHCGEAHDWNSDSSANLNDIWKTSYNCSPDSESLFSCEATKLPPDYNETAVATVKCSESLTIKLTKGCWGSVNVCMGDSCGGVCRDSWTDEKSKMLCKEQGCGETVLRGHKNAEEMDMIFKSLHTTKHTKSLTQCNFVPKTKNESKLTCEPAYVICSGSVKPRFDGFNSRYSCSGNVEVFYEGEFLPVCLDALSSDAQETICKELKCGQANKTLAYFRSKREKTAFIKEIQCPANPKSLKGCTTNRTSADDPKCSLGGLQCSNWRKVELNLGQKVCSGDVYVDSKGGRLAVPTDGQTYETMGRTLCKDLNCGDFIKFHNKSGLYPFWDRTFSCQDGEKPENIWECEKARKSSPELQLSIECQDPNVTFSGECHGEVRINNTHVCKSNWNHIHSDKLCQEKGCGIALFSETGKQKTKMYHVNYDECDRLGECNRYEETCNDGPLSVYCVRNVEFNFTEHCGGQIEIIYQDKREKVCEFPTKFQDKLCEDLGCKGFNSALTNIIKKDKGQKSTVKLEKTVDCSGGYTNYKYCVKPKPCEEVPAEIYCTGYKYESPPPPPSAPTPVMAIVVVIGLVLVLVILIALFVRVYIVRRARRAKMAMNASRMYSSKEVEFESGDYEDVTNKSNEMEDFSHGNFRRDADGFMESDERSNTSLPYDDIDEVTETQPLTSPAPTKADVSYFQDDGVTYEVDDPQENYDDIEPGPEVTETKAEVHASPETTPESVPAAPPGRAQGEEDYLVPGQDG